MKKNIKAIVLFLIIIIFTSVIVFVFNNNYKNEIGGYDIYTLVILEKELDDFIELYNSGEIDGKSMRVFQDKIDMLNEYIRRSPVLNFMNRPLGQISDYNLNDINKKDIEWMRQIQKEIRKITIDLHDRNNNDNIGVLTYDYFKNEDNIEYLTEILNRLE